MKKLKKIIIAALLLLVALVLSSSLWLGPTIKNVVEGIGPDVLGVPMQVQKVKVSPLSGKAYVRGLVMENPEGFTTDSAVKIGEFYIDLKILSLLSDPIRIKKIYIQEAEVTCEGFGKRSNLAIIKRNIRKRSGSKPSGDKQARAPETKGTSGSEKEEAKSQRAKQQKKVIIDELVLAESTVRFTRIQSDGQPFEHHLPDIRLEDVGKKNGGATAAEVASQLFAKLEESAIEIFMPAAENIEKNVEQLEVEAEKLSKKIQEELGEDGENLDEIAEKASKELNKAFDSLFKKRDQE